MNKCRIHDTTFNEKLSPDGQRIIKYCLTCEAKQKLDNLIQTRGLKKLKREYFKGIELLQMLFIFPIVVAMLVGTLTIIVYMVTYDTFFKTSTLTLKFFLYSWIPLSILTFVLAFNRAYKEYKRKVKSISSPEEYAKTLLKAAEVEQEMVKQYIVELERMHKIITSMIERADEMSGEEFELLVAGLFQVRRGYEVSFTRSTGDDGVDLILEKNGVRIAVQCKRYSSSVGVDSVQQVYSGKNVYNCEKGLVITNSYFTKPAIRTALINNIELWDRDRLIDELFQEQNIMSWEEYLEQQYA